MAALAENPLFESLDRDLLARLAEHAEQVPFRPGRKILKEGEPAQHVFCLVEGGVRIYHHAPGQDRGEIVVKLFGAPAFFGEMEVLRGLRWLETVETVLPSQVIRIPAGPFLHLLKVEPAFCFALVRDLSLRLCIATEHARVLAFTSLEARLASFVLDHVQLFGVEEEDGTVVLDLKLSQDTVARSLAASRKSVNATFGAWRERGILDKRNARYRILDLAALERLALESQYGLAHVIDDGKERQEMEPASQKTGGEV